MLMFGWMPLGSAALMLALINLARGVLRENRWWRALLAASLSCGGLAVVCALLTIRSYVLAWDDSSLLDVAPALTVFSAWGVGLGIALNLLALWLHTRVRDK